MHGEDYISLGFLFGEKSRVAYISDVSRFPESTEYCEFHDVNFVMIINIVHIFTLFLLVTRLSGPVK